MRRNEIIVSVCMITFNHELFIARAIDGVVNQKTDFSYQLIIGEDCSTDKTRKICIDYFKRYPEKILLLLSDANKGSIINFQETLKRCSGKYVALCDGDDYWIDPYKLQKQVDFLESNNDYILCGTNAIYNNNNFIKKPTDKSYGIRDFYYLNNLITCTVLFRNKYMDSFSCNQNVAYNDWMLYVHLLFMSKAKAYEFKEVSAVYRLHHSGLYTSSSCESRFINHIAQIRWMSKLYYIPIEFNYFRTITSLFWAYIKSISKDFNWARFAPIFKIYIKSMFNPKFRL